MSESVDRVGPGQKLRDAEAVESAEYSFVRVHRLRAAQLGNLGKRADGGGG